MHIIQGSTRPCWHITGLGPIGSSYMLGAYKQYSARVLLRSRFSPDSLGPDQDDLKTQTRRACICQTRITLTLAVPASALPQGQCSEQGRQQQLPLAPAAAHNHEL